MPKPASVNLDIQQPHQIYSDLVIIDSAVGEYQSLATSINPGAEAIILDSSRDGISQIAEILAARPHVQTLHLVSHGGPGSLQLGNSQLNQDNLQQIQTWRQPSLSNILIYGCEVAAGESGRRFVEQFSHLTGAAVAASSTKTGAANLGGNWELEFRIGDIWAALAFPTQFREAYAGVFATITVTILTDEDDGVGSLGTANDISLREAIKYSATGDTIQLAAGTYTLTLDGSAENAGATGDLDIDGKNLTIIGAGQATTTIDTNFTAGNEDRVFHLLNDASLDISALTITGGDIGDNDGGGIRMESGNLTITDVAITGNTADDGAGSGEGGGIYVYDGTVTITDSEISENTAIYAGGGIYIDNGTLTVIGSIMSGNNAAGDDGGAIYNDGATVTVISSLLSENISDGSGATIENTGGGTLTVINSTIMGNTGSYGSGLNNESGTATVSNSTITGNIAEYGGGGIAGYSFTINNTIVIGNTSTSGGPDVQGNFTSNGTNIIGDTTNGNGFTSDSTGVTADEVSSTPSYSITAVLLQLTA